jgi:hypothetical protein
MQSPLGWRRFPAGLAFTCLLLLPVQISFADDTWTYAVQLSAAAQANPARITLHWQVDPYGASSYTVYRKLKNSTSWGAGTALPGSAQSYVDSNVSVGTGYEYQVIKQGIAGYTGYGYIHAAIQYPAQEQRGKVILLVAADTGALANELSRFEEDLVGDGWQVVRHHVSSGANPADVKNLVVADYASDPSSVQAVILFGHVPILMSGSLEYDSHGARPMPADAFYGDMDGNWRVGQPPSERPSYMPSDIELMVGRVDFFNMPGEGAPTPWPNETELLRRYLNKNHAWRHKLVTVPPRAIMANRVGDAGGHAYAASGYRNFETFVGPGNIIEANVADSAPVSERWISMVSSGAYLWSYACGGGQSTVMSHLGTHGAYREVWSTDLVSQDAKAVFSMMFGSHFGDWTTKDNIMRAMLAAPSVSLTASIVGLPHWFVHHMAMGETIGYATRLTMNNSSLYKNQENLLPRCVMINLLGDPTLRMEPVAPPRNLSASASNGAASLAWNGSSDATEGYHVYRSASRLGPFWKLNNSPVIGTTYTDTTPFQNGLRYYMVRGIALQANPSGTYYNLSQGIFASVIVEGTTTNRPPVETVSSGIVMTPGGPRITWTSEPGKAYRVEGMVLIHNNDWVDLSGRIPANGNELSFTDYNWIWYWTRFYRVQRED